MKTSVVISSVLFVFSLTAAYPQGAAVIIKQNARGVAGTITPGTRPSGGSTGSATRPRTAAPATLSASDAAAKKIYIDLVIIKSRSAVTDELKGRLEASLLAAATGNKPNAAAVKKLAESVATSVNKYKLGSSEARQLANSLYAVMNGSSLTAKGADGIVQKAQDTLVIGGVPVKVAETVSADLNSIVAELSGNPAK